MRRGLSSLLLLSLGAGSLGAASLAAGCAEAPAGGGGTTPAPQRASSSSAAVTSASSAPPPVPTFDARELPTALASASSPGASGAKRTYKVAAIGDSITDEKNGGGGYLKLLRKKCPESRFDDWGKGGEMVNQMRKRFARDVLGEGGPKKDYTHVIVFGGVNDLYSDETAGRSPKKVQDDLTVMYGAARSAGVSIVAITIAPWGGFKKYFNARRGGFTRTVNAWIKDQVTAKKIDFAVDAWSLLSCGVADVLCHKYAGFPGDGLHFDKNGHQVLGEALFEQVFKDCR